MVGIGFPEFILLILIFAVLLVPVWWMGRILGKAGYSPWFALVSFVPFVNIVALWIFAFIPWPHIDESD